MKILITPTSLSAQPQLKALDPLRERGAKLETNPHGRPMTEAELIQALQGVDGVIAGVDRFSQKVIDSAPELRAIARYGVGYDAIDLSAAQRAGVTVTNTPGANAHSVAEHALGLMFAVARGIPRTSMAVAEGRWPRFQGLELAGRTLGVLGLGSIGREVAQLGRGIGMTVLGCDPGVEEQHISALGVHPCSLEEIFVRSGVLSLHLPLLPSTRNIVSAERIAAMPADAIVINTARGGLIDEQAAAEALEVGELHGIGLDAYETEPPSDSVLVGHTRVVATPHSGAHSRESVQRTAAAAVKNLLAVFDGDAPPNPV